MQGQDLIFQVSSIRLMSDKGQQQAGEAEEIGAIPEILLPGEIHDRKKLLEITGALITETYNRVSGERFRPRDGDAQRIAYIKLLRDLLSLHADLLKASHAPAFQGLPAEPDPEDLELEEAKKKEIRLMERLMYGLPPDGSPVIPAKGRRKAKL